MNALTLMNAKLIQKIIILMVRLFHVRHLRELIASMKREATLAFVNLDTLETALHVHPLTNVSVIPVAITRRVKKQTTVINVTAMVDTVVRQAKVHLIASSTMVVLLLPQNALT